MTNTQIIAQATQKQNFDYTGDNLFTYPEWLKMGYRPARGQRAFIKTYLWTLSSENRKKTLVGLFARDQVQKVSCNELVMV